MCHDHVFTTTVLRHLIDQSESNIIRFRFDNCSTQYKSKYVFKAWQTVASETGKTLITFYGTSGHGKGLVDAMSSFGVKAPIRKAVLTEDFSYQSSQDIYDYLINCFKDDNKKHFHVITQDNIENQRELLKYSYMIPNCRALHMISFFPDCSIQTKRHLCSCYECVVGNFIDCIIDPGVFAEKVLAVTPSTVLDAHIGYTRNVVV